MARTLTERRATRLEQRTGAGLALFVALAALAIVAMVMPYSAGASRQRSSALHYWSAGGCPEDEGEAWSQQPVNLGAAARHDCRRGAEARTALAAAAIVLGGLTLGVVQLQDLRRPRSQDRA